MSRAHYSIFFDRALEEFTTLLDLQPIVCEAIRSFRETELVNGKKTSIGLEQSFAQASFLMAHAAFEFDLNYLVEEARRQSSIPPRHEKDRPSLNMRRCKQEIETACGSASVFSSAQWENCLLLGKVRNCVAHALAYQDREFSAQAYKALASLGIRTSVPADDSGIGAFMFEASSVMRCIGLYQFVLLGLDLRIFEGIDD